MPKACGPRNFRWNGGRHIDNGYVTCKQPDHIRANSYGYVQEHILVAEKVLGRTLALTNEVHHINRIKHDNRNANLVICEDRSYHFLLHKRQRALDAGVHPAWMKCAFCKQYDAPHNLHIQKNPQRQYHRTCRIEYRRGE